MYEVQHRRMQATFYMCVTCAFPDRVLKGYACSALQGVGLGRFRRAAARCAPQPMVRARKTAASPSNDPSLGVASDADPPRAQVHLPAPPRTSSRPISTMEEAADRPVSADEGAPPDEPVYTVLCSLVWCVGHTRVPHMRAPRSAKAMNFMNEKRACAAAHRRSPRLVCQLHCSCRPCHRDGVP